MRQIIKNYSIGELGYIYNGRRKTKLLILAELEYLKLKNNIYIDNEKINIINNNDNLRKSEKYVLDNYKFINDKEFKKRYILCIENSLKEKGDIVPYKIGADKIVFSLFIMVISFFVSFYLILSNFDTINISYIIIEFSLFLLTWLIIGSSMFVFNKEYILVKTHHGKELYMKLNGLKNYIKHFGNFEEKSLKEIALWEEYILYAIILNESNKAGRITVTDEICNLSNRFIC